MSLKASNITFRYFEDDEENTLERVSIEAPKGKITILMGKSGSGKSTLAYIMAGLYPENCGFLADGKVFWDDINIHELNPSERVAYVAKMFQNPDLQFCMSNLRNEMSFCLENIKVPEPDRSSIIEKAVNAVGISHMMERSFSKMSGGEKQKCALACILALGSKCIILDEAFANIDTKSAKDIIALLKESGLTILAIDHNTQLWDGAYDNIISLDGTKPKTFDKMVDLHTEGDVIINASNLTVNNIKYPEMKIKKGSLTAIVGKSGSGKTTFFNAVMKQNKYDGELRINDVSVNKLSRRRIFSKCGIVFQNPANQFLALSAFDEVHFSVSRQHKRLSEQEKKEKTLELLEIFGLDKHKNHSPYTLSQGQQRRLAVLAMIAGGQEILLLDEPTYGQDYENICAIMELLEQKARDGLTVVYSTHNDHLAKYYSHQVIELGGDGFE